LSMVGKLLAAEGGSSPSPKEPAGETRNQVEGMSYIRLGRTNLMVSRLSLGGIPWQPLVARRAVEAGVNMVHGSNGYGTMPEQRKALEPVWERIWYVLKQNTGSEKVMAECVDNCLKTLKKDHVQIIVPVVSRPGVTDYERMKGDFEKLRQAGKVRQLGVTVHSKPEFIPQIIREVTEAGIFAMILTMYQPAVKSAADKELARAVSKGLGTMSMKTVQGAKPEDHAQVAAACLAGGTIHTLLKGINSLGTLGTYLKVAGAAGAGGQAGKADAARVGQDRGVCGACGACRVCPEGIEIPEIMRCITYYGRQPGLERWAQMTYRALPVEKTFAGCTDCGRCEAVCPRGLSIRGMLRLAAMRYGGGYPGMSTTQVVQVG